MDSILFNWFEVDFWARYVAENNVLAFNGEEPGIVDFSVTNFNSSDIRVYDVTNPSDPIKVTSPDIEAVGGLFRVNFRDNLQGQHNYLALTPDQYKKPVSLLLDDPSNLKTPQNGADYIIIAHESLLNSVKPLANHRKTQGLRVLTVNVTDVYDEFASGLEDPQAIKDFLKYAYENWQRPAPLYVLLVGDATLDYKDNFKTGFKNLVPTHLVETRFVQTASDNWFVSVSGDDPIPDMFIGRISVKTPSGVDAVVNKILAYEGTIPSGWNKNVQFVADNPDDGGDFEESSEKIIRLLPDGINSLRVYQTVEGNSAESIISKNINDGVLITNYAGHGILNLWAKEKMYSSEAVSSLNNGGKPPSRFRKPAHTPDPPSV